MDTYCNLGCLKLAQTNTVTTQREAASGGSGKQRQMLRLFAFSTFKSLARCSYIWFNCLWLPHGSL